MGWLFMNRYHMGGHDTPKAYLYAEFTYSREQDDGGARGLKVLGSACAGNHVYFAAAQVIDDGKLGNVFAIVCLLRWNPRSTTGDHFGYKDMDRLTMCAGEVRAGRGVDHHRLAQQSR